MIFNQEINPTYSTESFDTSYVNADIVKTSTPMTLQMKGITPNQAGEFGVLMIYVGTTQASGWTGTPVSVTSVVDTQGATWSQNQAFTIAIQGVFPSAGLGVWIVTLPTTATDTITITVADSSSVFANDYIGSTFELFKGVGGAGTTVIKNSGSGISDSVSITPSRANDFLVGGAVLGTENQFLINAIALCDSLTLNAPTTTRQTDANCPINKVVNFASGDQHPASATSQTYAITTGDIIGFDGDAIFVVDLVPILTNPNGVWTVGSSLGELFGLTDHEISFTLPASVANGGFTTTTLHYTCVAQDNPSATVNLYLFGGVTQSGASLLTCNGTDQTGGAISSWTASSGTQLFFVKGQCTSCSDNIILSSLYFTVSYRVNQLPTLRVSSLTTSSMNVQVILLTSTSTPVTISWQWSAGIPG